MKERIVAFLRCEMAFYAVHRFSVKAKKFAQFANVENDFVESFEEWTGRK